MRMWPLDFSDFFLEAQHDAPVTSGTKSRKKFSCLSPLPVCPVCSWLLSYPPPRPANALSPFRPGFAVAVSISYDCLRVVTGTDSGLVGILDVSSQAYHNFFRSHNDAITDVAADPKTPTFATVSGDGTVRLWDRDSLDQVCRFPLCDHARACPGVFLGACLGAACRAVLPLFFAGMKIG